VPNVRAQPTDVHGGRRVAAVTAAEATRVLARVVSGGQTGVDVAALRAARRAGLQTGGTMPRGWRTLDGPRPGYAIEFGMVEHPFSAAYPARTLANVLAADATLRIAEDFGSAGEECTWRAIVRSRSRHMDVPLVGLEERDGSGRRVLRAEVGPEAVARWLVEEGVRTLNVAGNSERTTPGIERFAEGYIREVFQAVTRAEAEAGDEATKR
jgi:hypothetical protein